MLNSSISIFILTCPYLFCLIYYNRSNLIESYDRLEAFIKKHLSEKFYIENDQRINVRDKIAREICANILIHREYSNPFPAKLIIDKNYIKTENANKPRMIGCINITDYVPYPKNPKIAKFLKEIGVADELGSGVRNVTKYVKIYSGGIIKETYGIKDTKSKTVLRKLVTQNEIISEGANKNRRYKLKK